MVPSADYRYSSDGRATTTMKKRKSGSKEEKGGDSPSQLIDARIKELSDWRGETLARIRILIKQADPKVVEELLDARWPSRALIFVRIRYWYLASIAAKCCFA